MTPYFTKITAKPLVCVEYAGKGILGNLKMGISNILLLYVVLNPCLPGSIYWHIVYFKFPKFLSHEEL